MSKTDERLVFLDEYLVEIRWRQEKHLAELPQPKRVAQDRKPMPTSILRKDTGRGVSSWTVRPPLDVC